MIRANKTGWPLVVANEGMKLYIGMKLRLLPTKGQQENTGWVWLAGFASFFAATKTIHTPEVLKFVLTRTYIMEI